MKDYYLFKNGRLKRKDNSLVFEMEDGDVPIPIEDVGSIFLFGEIDLNTRVIHFLCQRGVVLHYFNYYGWYTGSTYPRELLLSGEVLVRQVEHYINVEKRMYLAKQFVKSAIHGFIYNLKRYKDKLEGKVFERLDLFLLQVERAQGIDELMAYEGNARDLYYQQINAFLKQFKFDRRTKRPPQDEVNALISFVNGLVYASVVKEIYHTQLNPTISYLHEPFYRRYSLALDVGEIFKPIYGDRVIFELINNKQIQEKHFEKGLEHCFLNEEGRRLVVQAFDEKLQKTIFHRTLKRNISYQRIIRLELYRLIKHLLGEKSYESFQIWW